MRLQQISQSSLVSTMPFIRWRTYQASKQHDVRFCITWACRPSRSQQKQTEQKRNQGQRHEAVDEDTETWEYNTDLIVVQAALRIHRACLMQLDVCWPHNHFLYNIIHLSLCACLDHQTYTYHVLAWPPVRLSGMYTNQQASEAQCCIRPACS